ncbi:MAG: alpha/beta hydrolase [Candidatus Muproteobacteria bacterium RBG_16_60_9]|uniref:Alpha/beta hydrolase n=1 Tax=Candidatus Muproteobacteria bacterium RBG_16_60_9 TaxID=1817755 RepID=A0A1F6VB62_9PROT|nr:MAG: alpha/beta hydrolase [Candidatus Muproteobacteria bacterium RBG_16_60_9]
MDFFPGFTRQRIACADIEINAVIGGNGPPLLLLHGYPQTHVMWHRVAPQLAAHFTVVATDLRGYGDSSKPAGLSDHANYSKRAVARDQVEVMHQLGFERFFLAGHDRGGRVAHRLALDHPDCVRRLAVLDISPTKIMFEQTDMAFASAYYHWFFLIQPAPFPETVIAASREFYMRNGLRAGPETFAPQAWQEYLRCFDSATIHASCEDYRAAATIDLEHDRADETAGRKIESPLLVLWGENGIIEKLFDPIDDWKKVATDVRGRALPAGHYLPEEVPDLVSAALLRFFG